MPTNLQGSCLKKPKFESSKRSQEWQLNGVDNVLPILKLIPTLSLFRAQTNQMLCTFHQVWVGFAHTHMNSQLFTRSLIPLAMSAKQWHLQVFGDTLQFQKVLWGSICDLNAVSQQPLSMMLYLARPDCLKNWSTLHVGGSTPLAHAQFHKIIDTSTCFIWFVVSFLSDASLTMVNNWLDCFLCLSLTHFLAIWRSRILVHLLYFHDQKIKPAMYS